ncbi:MAG: HAD-IA family hydrolase [Cyanothece sp. SIO1E1]|nr:HAD-IA family hydrolase [Cyanothece sp. SIO1E1]
MSPESVKVIIFDFDGTIADTLDAILKIANRLAEEFGYTPVTPEDVERLKNMTARQVIKHSEVPIFKIPFLLRRVKAELSREIQNLQPIPEVKQALIDLVNQNNQLGIITSNSTENVVLFLKQHNLEDLFDFVYSETTLFSKSRVINRALERKSLERESVLYVGDEVRDIEAARKNQIKTIAVSWGFNSSRILADQNPDFLIHQPQDLVKVINDLNLPEAMVRESN